MGKTKKIKVIKIGTRCICGSGKNQFHGTITKREIGKNSTPRVLQKMAEGCGAWLPEATADTVTVATAAKPGRMVHRFWLAAVSPSLPPQRAH